MRDDAVPFYESTGEGLCEPGRGEFPSFCCGEKPTKDDEYNARSRRSPIMKSSRVSIVVLSILAACSPQSPEPEAESAAAPIVRTGDPEKRGYTDLDFPRVQELAEGRVFVRAAALCR